MAPAKRAGKRTFLVTENSQSDNAYADWHGSLTDFGQLLESL